MNRKETEAPRLIKSWEELKECKSETHELEIGEHSGWINPKNADENSWEGRHYLSTHTFYDHQHEYSTQILQECGFNVILANWDEESA